MVDMGVVDASGRTTDGGGGGNYDESGPNGGLAWPLH